MRKEERIEVLKQYGATMTAYGEKLTGDGVQNFCRTDNELGGAVRKLRNQSWTVSL
ncbi:hypothetical protein PC113_g13207 [Phytophthora cactorum]|uniref:Uncharacterized protein n=1 Tax=Phytophthora cactorum TaxID=29920 RepID=A0A8T0YXX2_9STRA|nr:hypothetical protein PC111_g20780 [Phytophthora cactorum]KAG2854560.1 hypothetical protein PC113_g13207 [Phytophthora cactorum]